MGKFKGKPGPWHWQGKVLCNDAHIVGGDGWTFNDADKRLISAAPELLKELERLREYVIYTLGVGEEDCHAEHPLMSSKSAINKALGENQ